MADLLRTPLYDWHVAHHGRMVEFGGWDMPVQYSSIVEEHHAVRRTAGLFDISHMGRLRFGGKDACRFLDRMLTNDVSKLQIGQVRYSLICNDAGGILDDVLVYRLPDAYWLVVNASNRLKIVDWLQKQSDNGSADWADVTHSTGMIAVQGPLTSEALSADQKDLWSRLKYYGVADESTGPGVARQLLSRTGYTGEDGCEFIVPAEQTVAVWEQLLKTAADKQVDLHPCGLGARDTLRREAAMPLYGHELSETIDPLTAGLSFAVKLDKPVFIGKQALVEISQRTGRQVRVGLELAG
ncbi:MAG: glycine cleavage system protein T, partial [Planctomycetales bacterium 12-60-4]